ncbi:MAG: hypothetical protein M9894_37715 [Planctomycetes bacterium]|nr:hypothetical protein [Planctomycetota bacterium]
MSDARLRELERRFRASRSLDDEVAWLKEMRRVHGSSRLRPAVRLDEPQGVVRYKVAYVSPCDAPRCPAWWALFLLHRALGDHGPDEVMVIANEGDRTLSFDAQLPQFDVGHFKARVSVFCAAGSVYFRATRRLVTKGAAGIVFVPSLVGGYDSAQSAEDLKEDLRLHGVRPDELPMVLQWLPGDPRPEVSPESLRPELDLPFLATFTTDRRTGEGIEAALFEVLRLARAAHLEAGGAP